MKLMHCKFEIKGHSKKTRQTHIRPKLLQYNSKLKKFYEHSLYVIKDGKLHKLVNWYINKPPKHLIEPYEKSKEEFTDKLNKDILRQLNELEEKKAPKKTIQKPLTELQQRILECWKKGMKQKDIVKELNKKQKIISESEKYMRNKGYNKENYQNNLL